MTFFSQALIARSAVLGVPRAGRQGQGAEKSPRNPRGNGQ